MTLAERLTIELEELRQRESGARTLLDCIARELAERRRSYRHDAEAGSTIEEMLGLTLPFSTAGEREIISQLAQLRDQNAAAFKFVASQLQSLTAEVQQLRADQAELRKEIAALPQKADFDTLVRLMNDETNAVAGRIDALSQQLAAAQKAGDGSISAADAQTILDSLTAESDRLKSLGANPADPVPGGVGTGGSGDDSSANA